MEVEFASRRLARDCADARSRLRAFGMIRAQRIRGRLTLLQGASTLEDLRQAPGRFHELRGDRAGRFAADLDGPYRLIFEPVLTDEEMPAHGTSISWSRVTRVRVLSIEDDHG